MDCLKILSNFSDSSGRITAYPVKRKMKLYVLFYLAEKFEPGKEYIEDEINRIIDRYTLFNDSATIRRELCGYGFLNRKADGTSYWLEEVQPLPEELIK